VNKLAISPMAISDLEDIKNISVKNRETPLPLLMLYPELPKKSGH